MAIKRIIVIHGRHLKPSYKVKEKLVREALLHGLSRLEDQSAYEQLKSKKIKYTLAYYGDINNELMLDSNQAKYSKELTAFDEKHQSACEPYEKFVKPMEGLFAHESFGRTAYKKLLKRVKDYRGLDEAADVISWFANLIGISEGVISKATPDMGAYLLRRKIGSKVRQRLQEPLKKSILAGDDICLISHSMGCIVSYDVLWKFSQMSEYKKVAEANNPVTKWITIGNPLGEPGVKKNLYDGNEWEDGRYPRGMVKEWLNISAVDDFVARDEKIKDDYRKMLSQGHVDDIRDVTKFYNFWVGDSGTANSHKLYGYLDNPNFAKELSSWILK